MKTPAHPGVWTMERATASRPTFHIVNDHGVFASVTGKTPDAAETRARLCTAAPDLLGAAKTLVSHLGPWIEDYTSEDPQARAYDALLAAIAKAEGK